MKINETQLKSWKLGINDIQLKPMKINEIHEQSMKINETNKNTLAINGNQLKSMNLHWKNNGTQ